jgi:hypothetical protein
MAMDELDRTFKTLLENIRKNWPRNLTERFAIEDLYQTLIPYRHNRQAMGLETNQEYEHALMRLLSGERGYIQGDPRMQKRLGEELQSKNPDLSLFREYGTESIGLAPLAEAALEASLAGDLDPVEEFAPPPEPPKKPAAKRTTTQRTTAGARSGGSEPEASAPSRDFVPPVPPAPASAPPPAPAPAPPREAAPARASAAPAPAPPTRHAGDGERQPRKAGSPEQEPGMTVQQRTTTAEEHGGSCRYCSGALPDGRAITFCPHCGQDLTVQQCPACGTELELDWRFCTTCGRSVASP